MTETEIYESYNKKVYSYIRSKVNDDFTAEDLCSGVFLKVYEKLDTFDESKASIATWIYRIAHNKVIDYYRSFKPTDELTDFVSDTVEADEIPEDMVISSEQQEALAKGLKSLSERSRYIIVAHYYDGASLKDIANELDISYSYIKILHATALNDLRKYVE